MRRSQWKGLSSRSRPERDSSREKEEGKRLLPFEEKVRKE